MGLVLPRLWRSLLLLLALLQFGGLSEGRKSWRAAGRHKPDYRRAQGLSARDRNQAPGWSQQHQAGTAAATEEESFTLDFTAVEGNIDNFMAQIKSLAQSLYPCSAQKLNDDMKLYFLANSSVTCNDGTAAGYYIKESKGSRRWLVFLEGGWYCFSKENCDSRYNSMHRLMSSTHWPHSKTGTGMLSSQPEENPYWWNANIVFIPYCSSDVWSGASPKSEKSEYAFMGALIIQEVVKELLTKGLENAKILLLAGTSAGGTGVLLNVDRVAEQLEELGVRGVQVRGLADSGWFLDNKQYQRTDCIDTISCAPTEAIKKGISYWNGVVPERCREQFKDGEEWNCFFGYKIYPTLRSPLFVVQWLFDEAQLMVDNVHLTGQPVQEGQWNYIQNLGRELKNTLKDVPAVFAPACLSHEVITKSYWLNLQVKGVSLPRALHCWDRSLQDGARNNGKGSPKGCPIHLTDSCHWPHCNPTCPTIRDQYTGQEMTVIQFLMHMGFDIQKMAQQQGLEVSKLLGMLSSGS